MSWAILQSWGRRFTVLVAVSIGLVLTIHLPGGVVQDQVVSESGMISPTQKSWQLQPYLRELELFVHQVTTGKIEYIPAANGIFTKQDFGPTFRNAWRHTVRLVVHTFPVGVALGVLIGGLYAFRGRVPRTVSFATGSLGTAIPDFLVIALGQWAAIWFWRTHELRIWYVLADPYIPRGALLPAIALTLVPVGLLARLTSTVLDEVMAEDYIRTARGKGVPEWKVILLHALKNALPRILAGLPTALSLYLSSLLVVERLTNWPGIVRWAVPQFRRGTFGEFAGEWFGPTPQMVSVVVLVLVTCLVVFEGMINTINIWANGHRLEMQK